jgi:hypothetical protein
VALARVSQPGAFNLYRVCQIADALDASLDWLLGRSDIMEMPEPPKREAKRTA